MDPVSTSLIITPPFAGRKRRAEEELPSGTLGSHCVRIIVDNLHAVKALEQSILRSNMGSIPVQFDFDREIDAANKSFADFKGKTAWARDNRVIRHDDTHLVPYPLELSNLQEYLYLFCLINHIPNPEGFYELEPFGRGPQFIDEAHQYANRLAHSIYFSKCLLEGGNVILFTDKEGNQKAIIGTHSIALSLIALEKENGFEEFEDLGESPVNESFLIKARNIDLLEKRVSQDLDEKQFIERISEPLTEKERKDLHLIQAAKTLEMKWFITQQIIADELNIPVENIAFIDQENFHIDMDTLVVEDTVFVYDGIETIKVLATLLAMPIYKDNPTLLEYQKFARQSDQLYFSLNNKNRLEFEKIGLKMIPVAGRFETKEPSFPDHPTLNFLNGLLLPTQKPKEKIYAIAPSPYPELFESFIEVIHRSIPAGIIIRPLSIQLIQRSAKGGTSTKDPIGEMLTNYSGGLRCMTNMRPSEATSLYEALSPATTLSFETSSPVSDKSD